MNCTGFQVTLVRARWVGIMCSYVVSIPAYVQTYINTYGQTIMKFTEQMSENCVLVFSGLFKHSQELSKAYLADLTPVNEHAKVFGQFNSVSSIGFVFGPIIGGHLAEFSNGFYLVSVLTAAVFLLDMRKMQHFSLLLLGWIRMMVVLMVTQRNMQCLTKQ